MIEWITLIRCNFNIKRHDRVSVQSASRLRTRVISACLRDARTDVNCICEIHVTRSYTRSACMCVDMYEAVGNLVNTLPRGINDDDNDGDLASNPLPPLPKLQVQQPQLQSICSYRDTHATLYVPWVMCTHLHTWIIQERIPRAKFTMNVNLELWDQRRNGIKSCFLYVLYSTMYFGTGRANFASLVGYSLNLLLDEMNSEYYLGNKNFEQGIWKVLRENNLFSI